MRPTHPTVASACAAALALTLGTSGTAHAARHELSFEFQGVLHGAQDTWTTFRDEGTGSFGLRGGYAVLRNKTPPELARYSRFGLVIDVGWTHGRHSTTINTSADDQGGLADMAFALTLDDLTLGAKADVDIANVVYPYLRADVGLLVGTARLDGNDSLDDNETLLKGSGLAPTGTFTGGFEILIPDRKLHWPVTAAFHVEAGYRVAGRMTLSTFGGEYRLSGAVFRGGFGLRM